MSLLHVKRRTDKHWLLYQEVEGGLGPPINNEKHGLNQVALSLKRYFKKGTCIWEANLFDASNSCW